MLQLVCTRSANGFPGGGVEGLGRRVEDHARTVIHPASGSHFERAEGIMVMLERGAEESVKIE